MSLDFGPRRSAKTSWLLARGSATDRTVRCRVALPSIAWASPARRPGCAADQPAFGTAERLQLNGTGWPLHICLEIWTASSALRCAPHATGSASSGDAIPASPAGRSCWSPPMKLPAKHGQRAKVSSLVFSTAIFRHSLMRAGGYGRACRGLISDDDLAAKLARLRSRIVEADHAVDHSR